MTAREVISFLEKQGYRYQRQKGSHKIYFHPSNGNIVVIPVHLGKYIPPATLRSILKQADLDVDDFLKLI